MKNKFFALIFASLIPLKSVLAHCPLCTMATGAALVTARWLGIDDALVGVLFGGFVIASSLWLNNVLIKKGLEFVQFQEESVVLLGIVSSLATLQLGNLFATNSVSLWGFNRLLIGTLIGSFASYLGHLIHLQLRSNNNEKNYIPYQGLVFILASTLIATIALRVML